MQEFEELDPEFIQDEQDRIAKLNAFAGTVLTKRKEAIDFRMLSGIETQWQEDEEYYEGIDDYNRSAGILKPSTASGRVILRESSNDHRSTVFVNITQPYVDMAAARVSDMLLPTEDRPFSLKPTPIPEVADVTQSKELMPDGVTPIGEAAYAFLNEMRKKAEAAEDQIWDWLEESGWHSELRKVIHQCAMLGTGCVKGPYPVYRKVRVAKQIEKGFELEIMEKLKPASKMVDVWNIYPDPACGDNIHNGNYIFEKDLISGRELLDLKGTGYIDSEIDLVYKQGPNKKNIDGKGQTLDSDSFEIWYYHGLANYDDLLVADCKCEETDKTLPVILTLVNDRIIKASISHLDSGDFPYDIINWKKRWKNWAGTGVSRQVRTAQNMVNSASRNLFDNAGVSAGPQIILKRGDIEPADNVWSITPLKIWYVNEDSDVAEAAHAITSIQIPSMQAELENIIKLSLDFAERATSMPMILQGQQGANTQTVGGMDILNKNATSVLRSVAKMFDDFITDPHITRYYEWLLLYGENEDQKGDYCIQTLGSTAFYERDAQNQVILSLVPLSKDEAYELDPAKIMAEVLKMNKINPERVTYSKQQLELLQKQRQENPPVDPRVQGAKEVAQIKVQGDLQKAQLVQQSDQKELQLKSEQITNEFELKRQLAQIEADNALKLKQLELQMRMIELSQAQNISLEQIKAELAGTTMKLNTQKELSYADLEHKGHSQIMDHLHQKNIQAITPPTEPEGKAESGQSFAQ